MTNLLAMSDKSRASYRTSFVNSSIVVESAGVKNEHVLFMQYLGVSAATGSGRYQRAISTTLMVNFPVF